MGTPLVIVRGAGELGSAVAVTLFRTGYKIILVELSEPLAIRRTVTFSDAMFSGSEIVEGVRAIKADPVDQLIDTPEGCIPLVKESQLDIFQLNRLPGVIIDARMLKQQQNPADSRVIPTIGLGPGFSTGQNCLVAIETKRGHHLGRIIWNGSTSENTGEPGLLGGESSRRVIYSRIAGNVDWKVEIGDVADKNQTLGYTKNNPVISKIPGKIRGLISPMVEIPVGIKIADIDPRGNEIDHMLISDKANAIARAVLEAVIILGLSTAT